MSHKREYAIKRMILAHPRQWLNMMDIACEVNLTYRQTVKLCQCMAQPPYECRVSPFTDMLQIRVDVDGDGVRLLMRDLMERSFGITDEMELTLERILDERGDMTLSELMGATGYTRSEILRMISILDIEQFKRGQHIAYRRRKG